jgi:aldehyde:ferredoxin oxidoreductase
MDDLGPDKVRVAGYYVDWLVFVNCLGLCMFLPYSADQIRDLVRDVTGWNTSIFELTKVGERALTMARAYNFRQALTPDDDVSHWRFSTPLESGPAQGSRIPPQEMARALDLYYSMRGWDRQTGAPTEAKLHELGLGWLAG